MQAFTLALFAAGALGTEQNWSSYRPTSYGSAPSYPSYTVQQPAFPTSGYQASAFNTGYNNFVKATPNPWATNSVPQQPTNSYSNPWATQQQQANTYANPWASQQTYTQQSNQYKPPQQPTNTYTNPWDTLNQQQQQKPTKPTNTYTPPAPPTPTYQKPTYTPPTPPAPTTKPTPFTPAVDPDYVKPTKPSTPSTDYKPSFGDYDSHADFDEFFGQETIYLLQKDLARLAAEVGTLKTELADLVQEAADAGGEVVSGGGPFFNWYFVNDALIQDIFTPRPLVDAFCVSSGTAGSIFDFEGHVTIDTTFSDAGTTVKVVLFDIDSDEIVASAQIDAIGAVQSLSLIYQAVIDVDTSFGVLVIQSEQLDKRLLTIRAKEAQFSYKLWNKDDFEFTNTLPAACET